MLTVCLLCSCGKSGKSCKMTFIVSYSGGDIAGNAPDEGKMLTAAYGKETKSHNTVVYDSTSYYRKLIFSDFSE